ncbi:paired amphipathic helix protein Sin3a [Diplocarpon rosae]|nr:paired amphipathic helix protein Sin3a [Diplocarpon rosae]
MATHLRLPGALAFLFIQLFFNVAKGQNATLPGFGDIVQVLGGMQRTDQDFRDGLALDILSPKNRTIVVTQNNAPLSTIYMLGTTGGPFVALSNYSYIIKTSDQAGDLIAKIEIPYDVAMLTEEGIQESNTYVAALASDGQSWSIEDSTRNVHRSENNTRIEKMTAIDGEYILVGRKSVDVGNIFVQYGQGATRTANFTGGTGNQCVEFIDGMRFTVQTNKDLQMNIELKEGVNPKTLPPNTVSLNSFMWIVNTSAPFERVNAEMLVPFNRNMLVAMNPDGSSPSTMLTVGRRALNATSGQFLPFNRDAQYVRELPVDKVVVPQVTQLDGQYVILVGQAKSVGQTMPHAGIVKAGKRNTGRTGRSGDLRS